MLSTFFKKLLMTKQLRFVEGDVAIFNSSYTLSPISLHLHLRNSLEATKEADYDKITYEVGGALGKEIAEELNTKFKVKGLESLSLWQNLIELHGLAKVISISSASDGRIIVRAASSLAKEDILRNGKQTKVTDYFLAGFLFGVFKVVYGRDFICQEKKCIACGDSECVFTLSPK